MCFTAERIHLPFLFIWGVDTAGHSLCVCVCVCVCVSVCVCWVGAGVMGGGQGGAAKSKPAHTERGCWAGSGSQPLRATTRSKSLAAQSARPQL